MVTERAFPIKNISLSQKQLKVKKYQVNTSDQKVISFSLAPSWLSMYIVAQVSISKTTLNEVIKGFFLDSKLYKSYLIHCLP